MTKNKTTGALIPGHGIAYSLKEVNELVRTIFHGMNVMVENVLFCLRLKIFSSRMKRVLFIGIQYFYIPELITCLRNPSRMSLGLHYYSSM